jgi:hypothetical protein
MTELLEQMGVIVTLALAAVSAIVAFVRVQSQLRAHEVLDNKRFEAIENRLSDQDDMLKEIRIDIKSLLQRQ